MNIDNPAILPSYRSFLLRFWPEQQPPEQSDWRFTLQDPRTGERLGFNSLESLTDYLNKITKDSTD